MAQISNPHSGEMININKMTIFIKLSILIILIIPFSGDMIGQGRSFEKIYVHTDRDVYIAGEELLFSLYLIDGTHPGSAGKSRVVYIEIIDQFNDPIAQKRVGIYNGCVYGNLELPDTLTSGDYILRAYTNAMKSYGPDGFFSYLVRIYNPFKSDPNVGDTESIIIYDSLKSSMAKQSPKPLESQITVSVNEIFKPRERAIMRIALDTAIFKSSDLTSLSVSVAVNSGHASDYTIADYLSNSPVYGNSDLADLESIYHNIYLTEEHGPYLEGQLLSKETLLPGQEERNSTTASRLAEPTTVMR